MEKLEGKEWIKIGGEKEKMTENINGIVADVVSNAMEKAVGKLSEQIDKKVGAKLEEVKIDPDLNKDGKVTEEERTFAGVFSQILNNQNTVMNNIQKNANISNIIMAIFLFASMLLGIFG